MLAPASTWRSANIFLVGSDDSELAVARIVSVGPDGVVQTRVLLGPAAEHLYLVGTSSTA